MGLGWHLCDAHAARFEMFSILGSCRFELYPKTRKDQHVNVRHMAAKHRESRTEFGLETERGACAARSGNTAQWWQRPHRLGSSKVLVTQL